jgi:transglutaminase-like putative cysteine protease
MMPLAWNWFRKNYNLVLLLAATACLALALGKVIRGATWSWLMPVSLLAAACGWGLGGGRLKARQAWLSLTALGIPGVFAYVAGLFTPLGQLLLSVLSLFPQVILWFSERAALDFGPLLVTWTELSGHIAGVGSRLWAWCLALVSGGTLIDPLAAGLVWNLLLWLVGAWAGWQLRRERQALQALAPGGALLALVLDYTRGEIGLLIVYLAILLALMGLARNEWRHVQWQRRKVDYAESIVIDTLAMVGMVTIALVLSAAGTPSLSWRELVDRLRGTGQEESERVAESLGLEAPPNVAVSETYRANGLPRQHLLDLPPEQLQDVVLTVSTGEIPPLPETIPADIQPAHYRWRAITYDVYSGAGWGSSPAQAVPLPADTPLLEPPQGYRIVNQQVKRVPSQGAYVYWTGALAQADADIEIAWRVQPPGEPSPAHNGDMLGALTGLDEYTVVSYLPQASAEALRGAGSDYPAGIVRRYLGLPESTPERVLALARELTQAAPTPYDRALAIEAYLRAFPYTLEVEPPPAGRDVVDYFLFTARQGYCDYYASSMVVLARAVGLPARLVIGYASGEYNAPAAEYIVRQEDAHSWIEIYFPGIGWVEFEPTAGQPPIVRPGETNASEATPGLPAENPAIAWLKTSWRALVTSLSGQLLIAGTGLILLFTLWQVGELCFLHLLPSQKVIVRMYARMESASARLLPGLPAGHTPHQLQHALTRKLKDARHRFLKMLLSPAEGEIESVVALHVAQVFSQRPPGRALVRVGIRAWARLRWRLWIARIARDHLRQT